MLREVGLCPWLIYRNCTVILIFSKEIYQFSFESSKFLMRRFLQWLLRRPITYLANRVSSSPDQEAVFRSLSELLADLQGNKPARGLVQQFDLAQGRFVIVSDQHKGARDAADDFRVAETNYREALQYYYEQQFTLINNGDAEELWENTPPVVIEKNRMVLLEEARFLQDKRYYRIFGNHDLEWKYDIPRHFFLKPLFGESLKVVEGVLLQTSYENKNWSILISHGHQGDQKSDGNPFSTWVVAAIWTPLQRFLEISINTTADSYELVDKHNIIMHEWSTRQERLLFISGHTHKPVFASLDHIDRLNQLLATARQQGDSTAVGKIEKEIASRKTEYAGKGNPRPTGKPSYFNTGCCCFSDGDMTAIEIENGMIRLVKWQEEGGKPVRVVLEESGLGYVFEKLEARS